MCVSLAVLRRCRASSTTELPKARAAVSAEGKAELIEQQYGVQQQQAMAGGGGEGDVQDGKKRAPQELPPPRTQLAPHHRYQPATDADVAAAKFPCPETSGKRRLRALAPLPNRVAPSEQVLSLPIAPSLPLPPSRSLPPAPSSPGFSLPLSSSPSLSFSLSCPPPFFLIGLEGASDRVVAAKNRREIRDLKKAGG
jgi:hypothetical protein